MGKSNYLGSYIVFDNQIIDILSSGVYDKKNECNVNHNKGGVKGAKLKNTVSNIIIKSLSPSLQYKDSFVSLLNDGSLNAANIILGVDKDVKPDNCVFDMDKYIQSKVDTKKVSLNLEHKKIEYMKKFYGPISPETCSYFKTYNIINNPCNSLVVC